MKNKKKAAVNQQKVKQQTTGENRHSRRRLRLSSIQNKIVLCFTVPIFCMIIVGVIAYQKASEGMSRQFLESAEQTINMAATYMDAINYFVEGEAKSMQTAQI